MAIQTIRSVTLSALLVCGLAQANVQGNVQSQTMISEAAALMNQGKMDQAHELYQRAIKADPTASVPVSSLANFYLFLSGQVAADKQPQLRAQARKVAQLALRLDDQDPLAQEILRKLEEDGPSVLHEPNERAAGLITEGEALFHRAKYAEALIKFDAASEADPQGSSSHVLAGDCFYARNQWQEAEARFRRAVELEPLNAQGWRFLADAVAHQGKTDDAYTALINSISAHPGQLPSWTKLSSHMAHLGKPIESLRLERRGDVKRGADGKLGVVLDESLTKENNDINTAFWLAYALSKAAEKSGGEKAPSAYQAELRAWRSALKVLDEIDAKGSARKPEPAVVQLRQMNKEGQLEAALFLLTYKESYRPDFEAWKRSNPSAIRQFLTTYRLRP